MTVIFKTFAIAASVAVLAAAGAQAQSIGGGGFGGRKHQQQADKTAARTPKVDEKAYDAALKTLPDKAYDPWRGVR